MIALDGSDKVGLFNQLMRRQLQRVCKWGTVLSFANGAEGMSNAKKRSTTYEVCLPLPRFLGKGWSVKDSGDKHRREESI